MHCRPRIFLRRGFDVIITLRSKHMQYALWISIAVLSSGVLAAPSQPHELYAGILTRYVDAEGRVNYAQLKTHRADLDTYVQSLGKIQPEAFARWSEADRLALLMNAYNAFTLKLIIDHYPIQSSFWTSLRFPKNSIRQISGAWDTITFDLIGKPITLGDLEHKILRKQYDEPRIHMAINCASAGCPPLRDEPFSGEKLGHQLADQTQRFLADPAKFRIDKKNKTVYLSSIFKWFGADFEKRYTPKSNFGRHDMTLRSVLNFISAHLTDEDADWLKTGDFAVHYLDYDWTLNQQP